MAAVRTFAAWASLCVVLVWPVEGSQPDPTSAADRSRPGVLLVSLDDPNQPYVREVDQGFVQVLNGAKTPPVLFREFYDQVRFGDDPDYQAAYLSWLWRKYLGHSIDAIVVTQQQTLQLFKQGPHNPWNDVPVVYGTFGDLTVDISASHPTASGVVLENPVPRLLDAIKVLLPQTKRIAPIYGSSPAERRNDWFVPQIRAGGFETLDLTGLTLEQLLKRLSGLPEDTVPLLLDYQVDAAGRILGPEEALRLIAGAANRPLFTFREEEIGRGPVGGVTAGFSLLGRELAITALQRLEGSPPSTVTIPAARHTSILFDSRQLTRWKIPDDRLPPGSVVRFRPPSLWRDYRGTVIAVVVVGMLQTALIIGILFERRHRARAQADLRASYGQMQLLADRLITAQEEERTRIARDLHDDIGQRVASLSIALSRMRRLAADASEPLRDGLSTLQRDAGVLTKDLRNLSHDLHPGSLEHLGLIEALRIRLNELHKETHLDVHLEVADTWTEVPDNVALCLYRVAQEALRNVGRHAAATQVVIDLDRGPGHVVMRVTDNGKGVAARATASPPGLGLVSMAERVRMLGGTLDVRTPPQGGTVLAVSLPVGEQHAT
jgi:signal transduction histidine kinase